MGKARNSIIISGIIVAFIFGSISSVTLVEGSPASDAALIAALNEIRDAILGISPTQTVTVESATPDVIVNAPQGPEGPQGATGPTGPTGPAGADTYVKTLSLFVPTGAGLERTLEPTCNTGDVATGGGYSADSPSVLSYIHFRPNPDTQDSIPTSWITSVKRNPGFDNNPITFRAYVICNDLTP